MKIELKCNCEDEKCEEWAIVELQGVIEPQSNFNDNLRGLHIGLLCRPSSQENYTFTVGYHELAGSKVTLKKPFLVLKKTKHSEVVPRTELEVVGVIRHKICLRLDLRPSFQNLNQLSRNEYLHWSESNRDPSYYFI